MIDPREVVDWLVQGVAARLESLASKLSRTMVVSEAFAKLCSRPLEDLGSHDLKGVDQPQRAFAPKA